MTEGSHDFWIRELLEHPSFLKTFDTGFHEGNGGEIRGDIKSKLKTTSSDIW